MTTTTPPHQERTCSDALSLFKQARAIRDAAVRAELRRRSSYRGERKRVAHELGTTTASLSRWISGKQPISDKIAERVLAEVRADELDLADRIEAELYGGRPPPSRRLFLSGWCAQCERKVHPNDAARCRSRFCKAKCADDFTLGGVSDCG